jgi:hypothetical protein
LFVFPAIGLFLFLSGFVSILRIRNYIKGQQFPASVLEAAEASEKVFFLVKI